MSVFLVNIWSKKLKQVNSAFVQLFKPYISYRPHCHNSVNF